MTRQCWAYNLKGDRCQKPPGHKGPHQIKFLWEDNDCYSPQGKPLIEVFAEEAAAAEEAPQKCIACKHSHKAGQCKCGCYEYVG